MQLCASAGHPPDGIMPDQPAYRYRLHGLVISSSTGLPELAARRLATALQPDVHVRLGPVKRPEYPMPAEPTFLVLPGGASFLEPGEVARYLVSGGREVLVDPEPQGDPALVRAFLLSWG